MNINLNDAQVEVLQDILGRVLNQTDSSNDVVQSIITKLEIGEQKTLALVSYVVEARTGCSCCSSENHYRGPYKTREQADAAAKRFHEEKLLASQYARNGSYSVEEHLAEVLPDGRLVINNRIYDNGFVDYENNYEDYMGRTL